MRHHIGTRLNYKCFIVIFISVTIYAHYTIKFTLEMMIRLEGGSTPNQGHVLLWNAPKAEFRQICDDYWDK